MSTKREIILDTVLSVKYHNSIDNPDLFHQAHYQEAPFFTTQNTNSIQPCNGWDVVNGIVMSGSDVLFQKFPTYFYQIMRDWTNVSDLKDNQRFINEFELSQSQSVSCRRCGFRLTTNPTSLKRFCLSCFIDNSAELQVDTRQTMFMGMKEKAFQNIMNIVFVNLFDDQLVHTNPNAKPLMGIFDHFLFQIGYHDQEDYARFTLFEDFEQETLKEAVIDDFVNSMDRQTLGIHLFVGIELIGRFIDDLYDPHILNTLVPGYQDMLEQTTDEDDEGGEEENVLNTDTTDDE